MKVAGRLSVWIAVLVLLAGVLAASGVRAQDQTPASAPGDLFASQGQPPIYTDQYASDCEASNANNPYAGTNPLVCHGEMMPAQGNSCNFPGMTLIKQVGSNCFYCLAMNPPVEGVILPIDAAGIAEKQGWRCGEDQADSCMLICTGTGPYKPPAGVRLMSNPPGTPPQAPTPPTAPSGTPAKPPNQVPILKPGYDKDPCFSFKAYLPQFTAAQLKTLNADLPAAKAILLKAKTYTDKNPWDAGTQAISKKYFGDASPATQKALKQDIANVLSLLNGISNASDAVYPAGADLLGPPAESSSVWAYVYQTWQPEVFVSDSFWQQPAAGPDSQPMIILHELSHLPGGASTLDFTYGQDECQAMVFFTTTAVGKGLVNLALNIPKGWLPATTRGSLKTLAKASPLANADSFKYFVYEVANQK